jgi:hypothetical protein
VVVFNPICYCINVYFSEAVVLHVEGGGRRVRCKLCRCLVRTTPPSMNEATSRRCWGSDCLTATPKTRLLATGLVTAVKVHSSGLARVRRHLSLANIQTRQSASTCNCTPSTLPCHLQSTLVLHLSTLLRATSHSRVRAFQSLSYALRRSTVFPSVGTATKASLCLSVARSSQVDFCTS